MHPSRASVALSPRLTIIRRAPRDAGETATFRRATMAAAQFLTLKDVHSTRALTE